MLICPFSKYHTVGWLGINSFLYFEVQNFRTQCRPELRNVKNRAKNDNKDDYKNNVKILVAFFEITSNIVVCAILDIAQFLTALGIVESD